jgi:triacylglycerol lipase
MPKPAPVYNAQFVLRPEQDTSYIHFENAAAHPFRPDPAELPRVNVWWLIEAALLSYWDPAAAIPVFNAAGLDAEFVEADGTQCYVAWQADWLLVAFRGTEGDQWGDILTDARFAQIPWKVGHTHAGFTDAVRRIEPKLTPVVNRLAHGRKLWFCGHSLGAALATLAADLYADTRGVCTFGTPRIGDRTFSVAFSEKFARRSLRYVNGHDVVTHVPPPVIVPWHFRHVAPARFITQSGRVSTLAPYLGHFFSDLFGHPETLLEVINGLQCGLFAHPPRFFLDHMPKAYAIWTWNDYETQG